MFHVKQQWEGGLDYVRLSYTVADRADWAFEVYRQLCWDTAESYSGRADFQPWGFQGYTGVIAGKAACGTRPDGALLQLTSFYALSPGLFAMPYTGVPRLDIAVTVWGQASPQQVPRDVADQSHAASRLVDHRPWEVACYDKYGKGDTAYLGSRDSEWFVRVYDKGAESEDERYAGAVRYEVQLGGKTALQTYQTVLNHSGGPEACASLVRGYLQRRGVSLPDCVSVQGPVQDVVRKEPSTLDQSVRWLERSVKPTVLKLLRRGYTYEEVHSALFGLGPDGWIDRTTK